LIPLYANPVRLYSSVAAIARKLAPHRPSVFEVAGRLYCFDVDLPDRLCRYINRLSERYPGVAEIWLLGSRCTGSPVRESSDWDPLAFADLDTLDAMRRDLDVREPDMDLLVVTDGDCFEQPWIEDGYQIPKRAYLSSWGWKGMSTDARTLEYSERPAFFLNGAEPSAGQFRNARDPIRARLVNFPQ
jgi:predicted nucleotidyltransferase